MNEHYTCDVCNISNDTVVAGRWVFHCPEHKIRDAQLTQDNELVGDWASYALDDGELSEMVETMF